MTELAIDAGPTDVPLLDMTIGELFAQTVAERGDHEALVVPFQDIRQTWSEFDETVRGVAKGLLAYGVDKGDRVGMWSPNFAEWIYVQFATALVGAIQVNVNPAYRTNELEYAINQSGMKLLVTRTEYLTSAYRDMVEQVAPGCSALERTVYFDTDDWSALIAAGAAITDDQLDARQRDLSPTDPINIQYTSGTTGFPKGATLSHLSLINNAQMVGEMQDLSTTDRVCIPVPFYHCFGMVMGNLACCVFGIPMVIPSPSFNPGEVLQTVADERCTVLYGVPTMFIAELGHDGLGTLDISSLRTGIMAGSPCPIEVMRDVIDKMNMAEVTIAYGQTETSPVSTQTRTSDSVDKRVTTVGKVLPHVESKIVDPETGETVLRGQAGEYCTRGFHVMLGYWDDADKTSLAIDEDGWMHSGDLATMDDDGFVNIVGRIKDMIIRGGENVYPREIEEFLYTHPRIADAQVIGVPDAKYGEEIMAWVQLNQDDPNQDDPNQDHRATEDEIREFCKGKIAHFKIPRYITFVNEFPMTVTGKVRKIEMREKSIADLGLDAHVTETA